MYLTIKKEDDKDDAEIRNIRNELMNAIKDASTSINLRDLIKKNFL